jgi:maltoporin
MLLRGTAGLLVTSSLCAAAHAETGTEAATTAQISQLAKKVSDTLGLSFDGYLRGGFYGSSGNNPGQQYQLGGDLQHFRLGNEGDTYLEFGVGKQFDLGDGMKWGLYVMPSWYNGVESTKQIYGSVSGFSFAPGVSFWAGQRYHRIQDIHIVDNWLMQDGDNYGAGIDGLDMGGGAKLNLALYTSGNNDNHNTVLNNARRINLQLTDIATNPGGSVTLSAGLVQGDFALGKPGAAVGLLHKQKNFLTDGLDNSLFVQMSTGHAALTGEFYNLDIGGAPQAGARQMRVAEVINWQKGRFGGQALVGYQTVAPDNASGWRDYSLGGRVSWGLSSHVKLLVEAAATARAVENQPMQHLNKATVAVAISPDSGFWTRPEIRVYASRFDWNGAAAQANSSTFGANGRTSANTFGAQLEAWW